MSETTGHWERKYKAAKRLIDSLSGDFSYDEGAMIEYNLVEAVSDESPSPVTPEAKEVLKKIEGFTPGPWKYRPDVVDKGFYIETVDMSHQNTFIGDVGGGLQRKPEIKANATLIAYAPELYQLAQQYIDENERLRGHIEKIKELKASAMDTKGLFPLLQYITNNL